MSQDNKQNNKKESYYSRLKGFNRAVPIILVALALFLGLCFILKDTGSVGQAISGILLGLFSYGAYVIPVLIALHAFLYPSDVARHRRLSRLIFSVVSVLLISSAIYAFSHLDGKLTFDAAGFYTDGQALVGGGFVGSIIAFGIIKALGVVGYFIVAAAIVALYITYFIARNNVSVAKSFYNFMSGLAGLFASAERKIKKSKKVKSDAKEEKRRRADDKKRHDLYHDEYFEVDNGMQELSVLGLDIQETRSQASVEINPTLNETVHHKSAISKEEAERIDAKRAAEAARREAECTEAARKASETASHTERKPLDLDYGMDMDNPIPTPSTPKAEAGETSRPANIGIDEDAESVFTKDFDPFDFALGEKLASRPSTKASEVAKTPEKEGIGVFEQSINNLTEAEIAAARRKAEFEERKRIVIERENAYRRAEEARRAAEAASSDATRTDAPVQSEPAPAETAFESVKEVYTPVAEAHSEPAREPSPAASAYSATSHTSEPQRTESVADSAAFKPYEPPKPPVNEAAPSREQTETIRIERSMLEPDVATEEREFTESAAFSFEVSPAEEMVEDIPIREEGVSPYTIETDLETAAPDPEDAAEYEIVSSQPEEDAQTVLEPIPEEEQSRTVLEQRRMFSIFEDEKPSPTAAEEPAVEEAPAEYEPSFTVSDYDEDEDDSAPVSTVDAVEDDDPPFDFEDKTVLPAIPEQIKKEEPKAPPKPDYSDYKFPPIDLLGEEDSGDDESSYETSENGNKLIETLASFNVTASIKGFDRGPRITRYEVVPARGVRVSAIMNLFDDIALNLAAEGIRMEAPIPGKTAVGVEIPNSKPYTVRLRSLLETEEFTSVKSKTAVCVGKDVAGQPVFGDISKMPHLLIAGATGMGKSVSINALLLSILYKARPDEVKFIMIDPKKVEFNIYNGIPHLLIPVVTDPKQAAGALMWAVEQMEKRYEIIEKARVRNIDAYNAKLADNPGMGEPMPKIIIVIDELADLMLQVKNPVEGLIMSISAKARAAGIHLIIGTQRPSVDIITGVIKANIPTRISCKVMSNADSRTILDIAGAEKLLDKGDMLFNPAGAPKPKRVQGAFVSDSEVENIIEFIKAQAKGEVYDDQAIEEINRAAQKCSKEKGAGGRGADGDDDADDSIYDNPEFIDAVDVALSSGKISTSLLQRKLSIGFGKAAKYIDAMEAIGVVSGPNGQKPRDVLMSKEEWHEKLSRVQFD